MKFVSTLESKDISAFKQFVTKKFHDNYILLNDAFFDWQYKNHISDNEKYSVKVIKHQGEILGYCGYVPLRMQLNDKQIKGAVLANLIVDDKLKGFGMGTLLVKEIMNEHDICYVNGYSEHLKKLCQKLNGWNEMGNLTRMVGSIRNTNVAKIALNMKNTFGTELDQLWQEINTTDYYGVIKDAKYFNWRYAQHPLFTYQLHELIINGQLKGCVVSRFESFNYQGREHTICRIIDWVSDREYASQLFSSLLHEASRQGADLCDVFFSGDSWVKTFKNIGLKENSNLPLLLTPVDATRKHINWMYYASNSVPTEKKINDSNSWFVTKGDGDQDRPNIPRANL